jgi:restriction endonuclease Mrr
MPLTIKEIARLIRVPEDELILRFQRVGAQVSNGLQIVPMGFLDQVVGPADIVLIERASSPINWAARNSSRQSTAYRREREAFTRNERDKEALDPSAARDDRIKADASVVVANVNEELIRYLARHPEETRVMPPRRFEQLIAEIFTDMGYSVHLTPETRDGGRDLLAHFKLPHGETLTLVECKRFASDRPVGIDIAQRFLWVVDNKDRASGGLIATTSYFSPEALDLERQYQYRLALRDFEVLKEWLNRYGTWRRRNASSALWLPSYADEEE